MNEKEMIEYSQWMWADAVKQAAKGIVVYVVLLGLYWGVIA